MWMARLSTANAASFTASVNVGWGWQVRAISSDAAPNSMATAASAIHVAGVRADDVDAEHAVGLGIGEDFHEALGLQVHLCAAIGGKGKFAGVVGGTGPLQFLLALSHRGDLGIGVDHLRDDVVVHVAGFAGADFRHPPAPLPCLLG